MSRLAGAGCILTGASRGIGLAIARALQREGVRLVLLSRHAPPPDVTGQFIACDLADLDSLPRVCAEALRHIGAVDFLIHNAGVFLEKPLCEITRGEWQQVLDVNLTAAFLITRVVLPGMIARGRGRMVFIASTAGVQGYWQQAAYVASKHGLLGLARSLALEAKPHGIHAHAICPGGVDTDLIKGTQLAARLKGQPMIAPDDIAATVVFLLSQPDNVDIAEIVVRRFP